MNILKGKYNAYTIPLNAPLYPPPPWNYKNCKAAIVLTQVKRDFIEGLLPLDVELTMEDPITAFWISHYPESDLDEYYEVIIAIQTKAEGLDLAYYIPFIYVTNDKALAAGREAAGAPKKLADINLEIKGNKVVGYMNRLGTHLLDIAVNLDLPVDIDTIRELMPEVLPLLSLRILPGVDKPNPYTAQLIHWYSKTSLLKDDSGAPLAWTGNAELKIYGSNEDPLDQIEIISILGGFYLEFDMELGLVSIMKEY